MNLKKWSLKIATHFKCFATGVVKKIVFDSEIFREILRQQFGLISEIYPKGKIPRRKLQEFSVICIG